jgi:hypothetical protein
VIVVPPLPLSAPLKPLLAKRLEKPSAAHLALPLRLKLVPPRLVLATMSTAVIG